MPEMAGSHVYIEGERGGGVSILVTQEKEINLSQFKTDVIFLKNISY